MRLSRCLSALALSLLLLCSFLAPDFETDGDPAAFEAGHAGVVLRGTRRSGCFDGRIAAYPDEPGQCASVRASDPLAGAGGVPFGLCVAHRVLAYACSHHFSYGQSGRSSLSGSSFSLIDRQ